MCFRLSQPCLRGLCAVAVIFAAASIAATAQAPVSFSKVASIFQTNCLACHNSTAKMGGLVLESYDSALKGGQDGPVIIPGSSARSRMVLMLEGKIQPKMPLNGALSDADIASIRNWIDAGAKGPAAGESASIHAAAIPDIKPTVTTVSPITAVTFTPKSVEPALLAIGGYRQVELIDPASGKVVRKLTGHADYVRGIAFSPDGRLLAAAGGLPARSGEVKIWNIATGQLVRTITGHKDCIYGVDISPDGKLLATSSYDKLIKSWDLQSGQELRTLKDHIDAVFAVAFSPDGKRLASGSADRSVKIWDVATGSRLYTLSDPTDVVTTIAFRPGHNQIAAAGEDKLIRTWELGPNSGDMVQSMISSEDTILRLLYSADGRRLIASSADKTLRILDADTLYPIRVLSPQSDWVQALALSADGKYFAAGRYDGTLSIYDTNTYESVLGPIVAFAPEKTSPSAVATATGLSGTRSAAPLKSPGGSPR